MKRNILFFLVAVTLATLGAQEYLFIHKSDKSILGETVAAIDSITFGNGETEMTISKTDKTATTLLVAAVDSVVFGQEVSDTVSIVYSGTTAVVNNPLSACGVAVSQSGADIVVVSKLDGVAVKYKVSGTSTNGSLKVYSDYRFELLMNGVNLTNTDGPAVNIQSGKRCLVTLVDGSENSLTDGINYVTTTEDQKSTLFSEGQLIFAGKGTLTVSSYGKHAICSDDFIQVTSGTIVVSSAAKDAIHANDYFRQDGGSLSLSATGDAIETETGQVVISAGTLKTTSTAISSKGINAFARVLISGGTVDMAVGGNQSKGIKSGGNMVLSGGTITINTTGGVALSVLGSGYDPQYCTAIKSDSAVYLSGSVLSINSSGAAGKGISANGEVKISSGTVDVITTGTGTTYVNSTGAKDSYNSSCITSDAAINIIGGSVTLSASGNGGKGLSSDGTITIGDAANSPNLTITTTGARFLVSGTDYCHPKTVVASGAIVFNNGTSVINSTDDGIHSGTSITINGGNHSIKASSATKGVGEGIEAPLMTFNGGVTNVTATNDGLNATYGTVSGGTESNDNSQIYVKGGVVIVDGADAVDSNGSITVSGGTFIVNGPSTGAEEGFDYNGTFNINGGVVIAAGSNSNMTKAMSSTSTQPCMYIKSSSLISNTSLLHIENASGTEVITVKPKNGGYYYHVSSPAFVKGASYKIYTGGSYTGGSYVGGTTSYGLYTGGSYSTSGATLKTTTTLSTSGTVNTISF